MPESEVRLSSGLLEFESLAELRAYLKQLLNHFEKESDVYSEKIGALMRVRDKAFKSRGETPQMTAQNWRKVGTLYVNSKDTMLGILEILLEALEDQKAKAARVSEMMIKFEEVEEVNIPDDAHLTLLVRNGVPLRLVVGSSSTESKGADSGTTVAAEVDAAPGTLRRLGLR